MASNFPSSLDTFTNPSSTDAMDSVSVPHATQHSDLNDAVEALQAKVGADSSAVTTSHDYKIADHASRLTTLEGAAGSGLVFISRTTIGTAVSSVAVSGAFSTDYDNYKIVLNLDSASTGSYFNVTVGAAATGYYRTTTSGISYGAAGSNIIAYGAQNATSWSNLITYDPNGTGSVLEIQAPFLSLETKLQVITTNASAASGGALFISGGFLNDSTSHTSITFTTVSGTVTGGTIDVYGYAKA